MTNDANFRKKRIRDTIEQVLIDRIAYVKNEMLQSDYTEHLIEHAKLSHRYTLAYFNMLPESVFEDPQHQERYFGYLKDTLGIGNIADWELRKRKEFKNLVIPGCKHD